MVEITQEMIAEVKEYFLDLVEDYEIRLNHAWDVMDKWRCPLSYADERLFNDMLDAICDYVSDNDLDEETEEALVERIDMFDYA